MDTKEIILTPEGHKRLVEELAYREGEKHDEIVEAIREARAQGDLSENAEYDAAKEEQAKNEARIAELRANLANAKIVDRGFEGTLTVSIGATATLEDESGKQQDFTIVGTTETNSLQHKISNESPLGSVLIGHVVGDSVSYTTPTGKVRMYKVVNITR